MSKVRRLAGLFLAGGLVLSPVGRADLYGAQDALARQDFARAFELYRELAEMGLPLAQENLAVMYVSGEGVKRDNVLGYGWALIARENGGSDAMQSIISQLEPHLTDTARNRVAELQGQFGKAALQERLLPGSKEAAAKPQAPVSPDNCKFLVPANPDDYYPREAIRQGLSGNVYLEFTVMPDGRARNPRAYFALPRLSFDAAAAGVIFNSTFKPKQENGVAVPCSLRVVIKFVSKGGTTGSTHPLLKAKLDDARTRAQAGDPGAQLDYAILLQGVRSAGASKEDFMSWYLKAAQAGIPTAQFVVGSTLLGSPDSTEVQKGVIWLTKAADAGQVDAQADLANYLLRNSPDAVTRARAYELLDRAAAAQSLDGRYRLAALLASDADETRRNPRRALELLEPVMLDKNFDPTAWEIRAAACAMLGDFKAAQADQERAIRMATKFGWDLAPQKARLEKYNNNTAWTGDLLSL